MSKKELYFSVDIEADGPIPGRNSMLSFGCVALDENKVEHGQFTANLKTLPEASPDPDTMNWWSHFPDAWEAHRQDLQRPSVAMKSFCGWVDRFQDKDHKPVMVCMPTGFDFTFMYWYMMAFAGYSPFSFSCVDMKTYVMAMRKQNYRLSGKRSWPKRWFPGVPHTHVAVEDAREQGLTFINMLRENMGL